MDFKDISITKDESRSLPNARNYTERYSILPGGQVDLKKIELIQQNTVYHPYSKHADKPCHLYRLYKACKTSSVLQDNHSHTMSIPRSQSNVNLPSNVLSMTEPFDTSPICCNTLKRNDMSEEKKFICGSCKLYFSTVCQLHTHLKSKHSPERYIFDFSVGTAFIEIDKVCRHTQTDLNDLIELDKEQFNVETDCFDDNIKVESNFDDIDVDNDKLNKCYSDGSDGAAIDQEEFIDVRTDCYNDKIKLESNVVGVGSDTINQSYSDVSRSVATYCYDVDIKVENKVEDSDIGNEGYLDNLKTDPDYYPSDSDGEWPSDRCKSTQMNCKRARKYFTRQHFVKNSVQQINEPRDNCMNVNTYEVVSDAYHVLDYDKDEEFDSSQMSDCSDMSDDLALPSPEDEVGMKTGTSNTRRKATVKQKTTSSKSLVKCRNLKVHSKISDTTLRKCRWCRKTLLKGESYRAHIRKCERNVDLICFICDQNFPTKSEVVAHLVVHKNAQKYECKYCQKSFANEQSFQHHLRNHYQHKKIHEQCERCGKEFHSRSLKRHLRICNKDPQIKCDQCEMMFKTFNALDEHKTVHSDDRPYVCHVCGYAAKRSSYLDRHMQIHSECTFSCSECGIKLSTKAGLYIHRRIHTKNKPKICMYCEKSFSTNWNLKIHLRQHTGDTPYKCELCGKAFKQNVLLKLHLKSHRP